MPPCGMFKNPHQPCDLKLNVMALTTLRFCEAAPYETALIVEY
jgi:hypothetical protein